MAQYNSKYTGSQIDSAVSRALAGGAIDQENAKKMDATKSTDYPGCYYRTVDGVREWLNPPMEWGVEYRTTERYQSKPVYVKLVNFGSLPNNTIKDVAHGCENLQYAVYVGGESNGDNLIGNQNVTYVHVGTSNIRIKTNADRSSVTATVLIKYTKTTD